MAANMYMFFISYVMAVLIHVFFSFSGGGGLLFCLFFKHTACVNVAESGK